VARRRNRPKPITAAGEVLLWLLFAALLVPAGAVGWALGHYTVSSKTVTVTAAASTSPATTTAAAAPTTTAAAAPDGKAIFTSAGCGACHTFTPAGTSAKIGPDLDTAPAADAKKAGMALDAFVKQSIVDPNAYISPGFPKGVMPGTFGTTLSAAKIDALVSYITGGK
jgi:mono/diheme cytochrome c family protein